MTLGVGGGAMLLRKRVEVRAGGGAAVGIVSELMDVNAALGGSVVAGDVVGDSCRGGFRCLFEADGSADSFVTAEDCDCFE